LQNAHWAYFGKEKSRFSISPSPTIDVSHPGAKISPALYGIVFEEINHAGDGGLYVERPQGFWSGRAAMTANSAILA
jgi:hypothetical protein